MFHQFLIATLCLFISYSQLIWGASGFAYVTNNGSPYVSVIDLETNTVISSSINVGLAAALVAITPDGSYTYIACRNNITVIDNLTNTVVNTIGSGSYRGIAITPNGLYVYATNLNGSISVIDTSTNTITDTIAINAPFGIAITPDGSRAYITNIINNTILIIDIMTNTVIGTINGIGSLSRDLAITPDGTRAYVVGNGTDFIIDLTTNTIIEPIIGTPNSSNGVAISPDGSRVYIVDNIDDRLLVIDTTTNTIIDTINVGNDPRFIAITPDGLFAYVTSDDDNTVSVVDTNTNLLVDTISVGIFAAGIAITPDQAPTADFSFTSQPNSLIVDFDASTSLSPAGTIVSYAWDFGDSSTIVTSSSAISHTYLNTGNFPVTLTVTNSAGTSTNQVFTGQTMSRNGGPSAQQQQLINVGVITTTNLIATPNSSINGQPVTLTAIISSNFGFATGTVTFFDGFNPIGTAVLDSNSQAILTISSLSVDTHSLTAVYLGEGIFSGSTSNSLTFVVSSSVLPPPLIPLLPPSHFKGLQKSDRFATQTDYINILTWKSPSQGIVPVAFKIYRDLNLTHLVATIPNQHKLIYKDHNCRKQQIYTYYIVSVDALGNQSLPNRLTIPKHP